MRKILSTLMIGFVIMHGTAWGAKSEPWENVQQFKESLDTATQRTKDQDTFLQALSQQMPKSAELIGEFLDCAQKKYMAIYAQKQTSKKQTSKKQTSKKQTSIRKSISQILTDLITSAAENTNSPVKTKQDLEKLTTYFQQRQQEGKPPTSTITKALEAAAAKLDEKLKESPIQANLSQLKQNLTDMKDSMEKLNTSLGNISKKLAHK